MVFYIHHENPNHPSRWRIMVPKRQRSQLLAETHAGYFGGHFSEKVYDKHVQMTDGMT